MIISTVKSQPDGIDVRVILLKKSCHTHLKHFKPYKFILQKAKKPLKGQTENRPFFFCSVSNDGIFHILSSTVESS